MGIISHVKFDVYVLLLAWHSQWTAIVPGRLLLLRRKVFLLMQQFREVKVRVVLHHGQFQTAIVSVKRRFSVFDFCSSVMIGVIEIRRDEMLFR